MANLSRCPNAASVGRGRCLSWVLARHFRCTLKSGRRQSQGSFHSIAHAVMPSVSRSARANALANSRAREDIGAQVPAREIIPIEETEAPGRRRSEPRSSRTSRAQVGLPKRPSISKSLRQTLPLSREDGRLGLLANGYWAGISTFLAHKLAKIIESRNLLICGCTGKCALVPPCGLAVIRIIRPGLAEGLTNRNGNHFAR